MASCFAGEIAYGNPTGGTFVYGSGTVSQQGGTTTVTNTPGAIINWQGFSIASSEITRFIQQSAASAVLNRVTGSTPSTILGQLQSNGRVFLINPNGITIGQGAVIDVAGFVASSLGISDKDFVAGRLRFDEAATGAGAVVNRGEIKTSAGGMVYLVGQNIENHGIIKTPKGEIVLAAGKTVELVDAGTPEIRVQITAPDNQALNLGQLFAAGGRIGMYAGLIRHGGVANANTAVVGENGKIVFRATRDVKLEAGSVATASGPTAGSIKIEAQNGTAAIAGSVEANATAARGGSIGVSGRQGVVVEPTGRLSANGIEGGSIVLTSAAGAVQISGQVSASGSGSAGRGGQVGVSGLQVAAADSARISARGAQAGGSVSVIAGDHVGLDAGSVIDASGATGGTVALEASQGGVEIGGTVQAAGNGVAGGSIKVAAHSDITLADGSVLSALGGRGGEVRIEAREGTTLAAGLIDVSGSNGPGGKVLLLGPRVGLIRNAFVNAAGETGGGLVLVGGDFQGSNPDIQNAERTYVGPDVRIAADAIESGDGGKVIVWADGDTRFYGAISARGGELGGDGGFIEVSGKQQLAFHGSADIGASRGKSGTLLLDPDNFLIVADGFTPALGQIADLDGISQFKDEIDGANDYYATKSTIEGIDGNVAILATNNVVFQASLNMSKQGTGETVSVTATNGEIQFNSNTLSTAGGNINLSAKTNVSAVGGLDASGGNITISAGGTVTQTGALKAAGLELIGGGTFQLASVDNAVTTLAGDVGNLQYKDADGFSIGTVNSSGLMADSVILKTQSGGNLTLEQDLAVSGEARLVADGAIVQTAGKITAASLGMRAVTGIDVNSNANDVGTLALYNGTSGDVFFQDSNGFSVGKMTASGDFAVTAGVDNSGRNVTLRSGGAVTQTEAIVAAGLELLGTGSFDLSGGSNDATTLAGLVSGYVKYTDKNDLIIGQVNTAGLTTGGDIAIKTQALGGNGDLTVNEVLDTQTAGLGGKITLTNAGQLIINAQIKSDGDFLVNGIGNIALNNDIITTEDLVQFDRDVTLAGTGDRLIDTSQAAGTPTSGTIIFKKSLDGAGKGLTLIAPNTGDIEFQDGDLTGISAKSLAYLTIQNANNVVANGAIATSAANGAANGVEVTAQGLATFKGAVSSAGGGVTLRVNDLALTGSINAGANDVQITPASANRAITLGSAPGTTLALSAVELGNITTSGLLTIGDSIHTGSITIGGAINPANASGGFMILNRSGGIAINAPINYTAGGGNLALTANAGGAATGAITGTGLISTTNLALNAATGIGTAGTPLQVQGIGLAGLTASNTDSLAPANGSGIFLGAPSGNLNIASISNAEAGIVSLATTDGSISVSGPINAGGAVELTANATSGAARTLNVNGAINANGKVILRAADDISIGAPIDSGGGPVYIVAGNAPGMNLPGLTMANGVTPLAPASEPADTDGGVTISARIDASSATGPGGAIVINATESVVQSPLGPGGSAGLNNLGSIASGPSANNGELIVRTYNDAPGAAIIDLRHDNNPNGNANGPITLETRFASDGSAPGDPVGGFSPSNIDYRSYTGVVLSGIGTGADFVAIAATQNIDLNALGIQARNLTLIANAGDVNVNTQVTNNQINSGNPGGSLNLLASGDVNVNSVAGTGGVTIGRILPAPVLDPATGLPTTSSIENFNHDLRLVAQNDINVKGSIYLQGDLQLRADASLAEATTVGGPAGYGNGIGSVTISVPGTNPVVISADNIVVGTRDALDRPLPVQNLIVTGGNAAAGVGVRQSASATLQAAGSLDIYLSGNLTATGGTVSANNPVAGTEIENSAAAAVSGSVVRILGVTSADNAVVPIAANTSNIVLTGGSATATNPGKARADASALIVARQSANIDIGGDITITAGDATATGSNATAVAIAGTEIGTQITGTQLFSVSSKNMFITSGTGTSVSGGHADGFASLASSGAISITVTGQGPGQGLVIDGAGGSGLFDAMGTALVRVPGDGYPITVSGRIELLSPAARAPRQDALVVAGAPLVDESLLAAFLRATEASREESLAQDSNLQQRTTSKGQAGVCR